MKRIIAILLIMIMSISLSACARLNANKEEVNGIEQSEGQDEDKKDVVVEDTQKDLTVLAAYIYDNDINILVENTSDKPILNFRVAYACFDNNGFQTETEYETGTVKTANMMPGDKYLASFYGASGNYAVATVIEIAYQGDETWNMVDIDAWYKKATGDFTVDKYNNSIASLAPNASKAETNEHLTIVSTSKKHENQFSSQDDFNFTIKNTSTKDILEARIRVLEYDANGYAVSTSPYDTYCKNDHSTGGTINLKVGASEAYTDDLFFVADCKQYKCVIESIKFADETEWENPYIYEWLIVNNKTYK